MKLTYAIAILFVLATGAFASDPDAQLENELKAQLDGKISVLRNYYRGNKLSYGANGNLLKGGKEGTWSMNGLVSIESLQVTADRVVLEAKRVRAVLDVRQGLVEHTTRDKVRIEVRRISGGGDVETQAALAQVLLATSDQFDSLVPGYWRGCLPGRASVGGKGQMQCNIKRSSAAGAGIVMLSDRSKANAANEAVSFPAVIAQAEPAFTDEARQKRYQGIVILSLVVGADGLAHDIRVQRPLDYGLSDQAVKAVEGWTFRPAMKDGKPLASMVTIEVSFQLY